MAEKVIQWKASSPEDFIYFQPCGDVSSATTDGEDHTTEQDPSTLLFVHQSAWQRRLLKRYGNICLLDATYKTTRYALPLFFLVVRTNGDYQVVGSFVVQFKQHSDKNQTGLSCHLLSQMRNLIEVWMMKGRYLKFI